MEIYYRLQDVDGDSRICRIVRNAQGIFGQIAVGPDKWRDEGAVCELLLDPFLGGEISKEEAESQIRDKGLAKR